MTTLDPQALRLTMRQWATGVTVVTTQLEGEYGGMTVSSFTSVSLEPPTVLVCLNIDTRVHMMVEKRGMYAVSMLGQGQEALSNRFAGLDPLYNEDRFAGIETRTAVTGSPLLPNAIGWLDCIVRQRLVSGTHTIFIGEVVYAEVNADRAPLLYYNRAYQLMTPVVPTE